MSLEIRIEDQSERHAFEVSAQIPLWKIPKTLGENFPQILALISKSGVQKAGAPFACYLDIDWKAVANEGPFAQMWQLLTRKQRMRIGIPVSAPAQGTSSIESISREPGRFVTTIHRGAYHKVGQTYKIIAAWADENRVAMADHTYENYINDPTEVSSDDIETLIQIPLKT